MKIVAVNTEINLKNSKVINVAESDFYDLDLNDVDYVLVSGGDGLLRRVIQHVIYLGQNKPDFIIDPKGSFNVIAKKHFTPQLSNVLKRIESGKKLKFKQQDVYKLNEHIFLFSAGNLHDALHIHLSEILRVGILKKGIFKYILSALFVIPIALITLPFLIFSKKRFFIFAVFKCCNVMNIYTKVRHLKIDMKNNYNLMEIDGDLVIIKNRFVEIDRIGTVNIVV